VQTACAGAMQHAIALLEKTPVLFETLLSELPPELLQWKPAPDRWSISEVLAHLADSEKVLSERARRLVRENSPALREYQQPAGGYAQGRAPEHLACFRAMRRETLKFLNTIPAPAGRRTGSHSLIGTITLAEMLNEWASHDLGHLRQIAELYRAHAFHPYAGPFQRYSNPKP
jgi:DinB superfamily